MTYSEYVKQFCADHNIPVPKLQAVLYDDGKDTGVLLCSCDKVTQEDGNPFIRCFDINLDKIKKQRVEQHLKRYHLDPVARKRLSENDQSFFVQNKKAKKVSELSIPGGLQHLGEQVAQLLEKRNQDQSKLLNETSLTFPW